MASFQSMKSDPSSTSADDYITALMILAIVNTAQLLDINKCTLAMILYFVLERYKVSLWTTRTISLAWYVMTASVCVAA